MTIPLYDSLFARHAGKTATFLHSDDGQVISYDAFLKRGAEIAHVLQNNGVFPGDRIVVYPKEIEDVLNDIDGVLGTAVIGVAENDFGEAIIAALVAEPGTQLQVEQIESIITNKLSRFKHPRRYKFVQELPRNTMGKVQKNVLRERYANKELSPAVS